MVRTRSHTASLIRKQVLDTVPTTPETVQPEPVKDENDSDEEKERQPQRKFFRSREHRKDVVWTCSTNGRAKRRLELDHKLPNKALPENKADSGLKAFEFTRGETKSVPKLNTSVQLADKAKGERKKVKFELLQLIRKTKKEIHYYRQREKDLVEEEATPAKRDRPFEVKGVASFIIDGNEIETTFTSTVNQSHHKTPNSTGIQRKTKRALRELNY